MITVFHRLLDARGNESGFTTAELLGNAALGVAALAIIWAIIQTTLANAVFTFIQKKLGTG